MNSLLAKGLIIGGVLATTSGAIAGYNVVRDEAPAAPAFAEVLSVEPAVMQIAQNEDVCRDVEVVHQPAPRDQHRVAGTATGAVLGGLIGHQIGGGNGRKLATVVGAVAGGIAGNKVQQRAQSNDTYTTIESQCETVTNYVDQVIGYDVTYRIGDQQGSIRLDQEPGATIPLVNGEIAQADV
jgi:uncharacterized protein YcfJ